MNTLPNMSGIYMIRNKKNGLVYIGQSVDMRRRANSHIRELCNNEHNNTYLQNAWNKYGSAAFEFTVVELCDEPSLNDREIFYIEFYNSYRNGYNLTIGGLGHRGYVPTIKERLAVSERTSKSVALLNTGDVFSSIREASEKTGANACSISDCCNGQRMSAGNLDGTRMVWVFYDEYIKMTESEINHRVLTAQNARSIGQADNSARVVLLNPLTVYPSMSAAARANQTHMSAIKRCCDNCGHSAGTYQGEKLVWMYYDDYIDADTSVILHKLAKAKTANVGANHFATRPVELVNTGEVFDCLEYAGAAYGISSKNISRCCTGARKSAGEYNGQKLVWRYVTLNK